MSKINRFLIEALIGAFLLLFAFWAFGYWANALSGARFELKSCWDGFSTLGSAGLLAAVKYIADSWANSDRGKMPYRDAEGER